jgi:hypothetical protein
MRLLIIGGSDAAIEAGLAALDHHLPEPRGPEQPGCWTVDGGPAWCWQHDIVLWLEAGLSPSQR